MKANTRISIVIVLSLMVLCMAPVGDCDDNKIDIVTHGYMDSLFTGLTEKDAQIAMELWLNELAKVKKEFAKKKAKTIIFHNIPSVIAALKANQVDFIGLTSLNYFQIKENIPLEPLLTYTVGGHPGTVYYLLVSKDKKSKSLPRLKNMRFIVQKHDKTGELPLLWLNSLLRKHRLPPAEAFFGSIKMVETSSQAILPVFFKQADCCIVAQEGFETSQELNPQIGERLAIAARSPALMIGLFAARPGLSDSLKKSVAEVAVNLASYPKGKQILTLFRIGAFRHFQSSDLDSVLELIKGQNKYKEFK